MVIIHGHYEIENDPPEINDLASKHTEILNKMIAEYDDYLNRSQIIEPDLTPKESITSEISIS